MTKFILLFFLISVNEKVSYFKDLDYINFDGRDQTSKRDASFKVMSIDENNIVITNLKSKKVWHVAMSNNSKRVINKGSKFPGCVYIDSSLVFTNKLIRIKNCQRTMTNIQNIQVIKRVDSLNYIINICYLPGKKLSLNDINEGFTLDMYKKLSTKFVELKIRDLGDRVLIESISDTPKYERYELKKIDNSFFLTLENFKSELNF